MNMQQQIDFLSARTVDLISSDELEAKLKKAERPLRIKYGADPSAPDIHLGHVVGLNKLREFQKAGHSVIFIIGDFTGMIGDPSGKSATRPALTREQVAENAKTYQEQIFRILDPDKTEVRFNSEWFAEMNFKEVLNLSSHVTVAQMLARDDFSKRYKAKSPISLVEFLYPLIQAYDSVMVEADVELGGTDQIFNLLLGRELQKIMGQAPQVAMTLPLIEGLDGVQKMSKSLNNYIGIDDPPQEMFGKVMSISDELMWRYYEYILGWSPEELAASQKALAEGKLHPRQAKDDLASAIVTRFAGREAAKNASREFSKVFSNKKSPDDMPELQLPAEEEISLIKLVVEAGFAASNGEARRLIKQGAVRINDEKYRDIKSTILPQSDMILRVGKRRFMKIKV